MKELSPKKSALNSKNKHSLGKSRGVTKSSIAIGMIITLIILSLYSVLAFADVSKDMKESSPNEKEVVELLKSIETKDPKPLAYINPNKYIQHNLTTADGLAGFLALIQQLPPGSAKVNTVRVFEDGDYVFAHTDYNLFGPKVGFDIFRFESGKIVEHWDNLQERPSGVNPGGHTMIDGPVDVSDTELTDSNIKLVRQFVDDILVNGKMDRLSGYFDSGHYIEHNPSIGDGLSGLNEALNAMAAQGIVTKYDKIHMILGEGNFVLVVSEGSLGNMPMSFYDLFRVENGKIAEHWDTNEVIPPRESWKNNNGKF